MAEIIIKCKNCNTELAATEELLGQEVCCYSCDSLQVIEKPKPIPETPPVPEPEPAPQIEPPPAEAKPAEAKPAEEEISFSCIGCGHFLVAPGDHVGYNVRCDNCDTKMPVPPASNAILPKEKPEPIPTPIPEEKPITAGKTSLQQGSVKKSSSQPALSPKKKNKTVPVAIGLVILIGILIGVLIFLTSGENEQQDDDQWVDSAELGLPVDDDSISSTNKGKSIVDDFNTADSDQETEPTVPAGPPPKMPPTTPVKQIPIPWVERMAKIPEPLIMRDWYDVSRKYYTIILNKKKIGGQTLLQVIRENDGKKISSPIPETYVTAPDGKPGWKTEFFPNRNFKGDPTVVRIDPAVNFNWGHLKPLPEIERDNFTVRFTGTLTAPETKKYNIELQSDDGSALTIDEKTLIDNLKGSHKTSCEVSMEKGRKYKIIVDFKEVGGEAKVKLSWDYISPAELAELREKERIDFKIPSYLENKQNNEIFTCLSPVVGAKLVGLDPKKLAGFDILKASKEWYDTKHGLYRHATRQKSPDLHSGIYGYWSSIYCFMLADLFSEDPDFMNHAKTTTKAFLKVAKAHGSPNSPNFNTLGYDFDKDAPGGRNEPMNKLGNAPIIAWILMLGEKLNKDPEMLENARAVMKWYLENPGRYEGNHMQAPLAAARLNAEYGDNFDVGAAIAAWMGDGDQKTHGWGMTSGAKYEGVTCDGIDGARWSKTGDKFHGFAMGTLSGPAWIVPVARYDQRYAAGIAKYALNAAVSSRIFQGYKMDWDHQDHKDWKDKHDPEYLFFYESVMPWEPSKEKKFRPYACGDPIKCGWGVEKVKPEDYLAEKKKWFSKKSNNIALYMGNHVGLLGGICQLTKVPGILQWDCLKTDWLSPKAYPTYLYYNPYQEAKTVSVKLKRTADLYDACQAKYIARAVKNYKLNLAPNQAAVIVAVPPNAQIERKGKHLLANGVVIDYQSQK